ncbi:activating transcription factor 7-interacting protein 2 isoform X1 [Dipodomys merriami]|uniref:activating transcription factor 7-interacting protein 2 isoform X1 n=2 Tax=Dipodomys merriami TaxID=94247 RepID=UPI003855F86E
MKMASPGKIKQKILKAKKTMPVSCRKQIEVLNKPRNVDTLKKTMGNNSPTGNENLSTVVINSKYRHSEHGSFSLESNKKLVFSQKNVHPKNIQPLEEVIDSETRLESVAAQVTCRYQKPRKAIDSLSKLSVQETKPSQKTHKTHCKDQANGTKSIFEYEENYNKSTCCPPAVLSGIVQNTLDNERNDKMISNLKRNSNSESHEKRQNGILSVDSCFVPAEKTPNLVSSVSTSNYAASNSKTEEPCRPHTVNISNCKPADSSLDTVCINSHNQKKRMFSENKENVKRMKTSEPINGNNCVALDKQTAILELVRHVIRQEVHSIDYKLFDSKLNELNDRIGKTQCKSKHEALAVQLFEKISRLKRRIKTVLHQINCLEPEALSSTTAHETSKAETMTLGENQKSVDNPNERTTSVNCAPVKASRRMNSPPDCVEFVPKSNDDVMLISVESPNITTPVTSDPTDIRKITSNNSSNSSNDEIQVRAVRKRKLGFVIDLTSEDLFNSNTEIPEVTLGSSHKSVSNSEEKTSMAKNGTENLDAFEHLPPLPEAPLPLPELADKSRDTLPPQKAELKVKWVLKPLGIALTWNISKINPKCAPVESYHLFLCHENANSQLIWKKIGEIKALPLPMACTLSQFLVSNKYYFTVQSKDIFGRYGPFCDIKCIPGLSKTLKSL